MKRINILNGCPICNELITDEELIERGKCQKCSDKEFPFKKIFENVEEFEKFFIEITGTNPLDIQKNWALRFFKGKNFGIVAPTGMGKTTFGIVLSIYLSLKGKKCYIILPTSILVRHVYERILKILEKKNINLKIAAYSTQFTEKEKKENLEKIEKQDFSILITTTRFLDKINSMKFDLVFVDDVDSILNRSKYVDKVISLRGENGIIIVSGATSKRRDTKAVKKFREELGFDFSFRAEFIRNIDDYVVEESKVDLVDLVKKLGSGGLIFTPLSKGLEFCKLIEKKLVENGIKALFFDSVKKGILKKFENGEIDVLIGIGSFKSPLTRGIDMPKRIRYCIFYGVPRMEIELKYENSPIQMFYILIGILQFLDDIELRGKIQRYIERLRTLSKRFLFENYIDEKFMNEVNQFIKSILTEDFLNKIEKSPYGSIIRKNNSMFLVVSDPVGYIQGSGRTSRLFVGGITKGISILINDNQKAFNDLERKLKTFMEDFEFKEFSEENIISSLKKVDEDRSILEKIYKEEIPVYKIEFFDTALIIVESPTKARTIARMFGRPSRRIINGISVFEALVGNYLALIIATQGHILELSNNGDIFGINIENEKFIPNFNFIKKCLNCNEQFVDGDSCPACNSKNIFNKKIIVDIIRDLALEVKNIFIATDFDSEGEKIAYDIFCNIYSLNKNIKRLELHEITKSGILKALSNPIDINYRLVESQLVRRIEDRLVGYALSQKLQKEMNRKNLSAGRVQSPVLKWIIEANNSYKKKKLKLFIKLENNLETSFELEKKVKIENEKAIVKVNNSNEKIFPKPPYTTDTLLMDANQILGLDVDQAMKIAQDLFEAGLITYIRTDSTTVSDFGIRVAKDYLNKKNLDNLFNPRKYEKEGAHECIRPTRPIDTFELRQLILNGLLRLPINLTNFHYRLYDLIFRRFIASQCKEVEVEKQEIEIRLFENVSKLERVVSILNEGFNKFVNVKVFEKVNSGEYKIIEYKYKRVPSGWLFTEGSIVEKMKSEGIGRPSTYSTIVKKLFERGYIFKVKKSLISTKLGEAVINYLDSNYPLLISVDKTRELEKNMDLIENGNLDYQNVIREIYEELKSYNLINFS